MTTTRLRLASWAVCGLTIAGVGFIPSSPAEAKPGIKDVQAQVDELYRQAEIATERYNDARLELARLRKDAGSLKVDEDRQDQQLGRARRAVRTSLVRQYAGTDLAAASQVIGTGDTAGLLSQMSTMSSYDAIQQGKFSTYQNGLKALDIRHQATTTRADQIAATEAKLAADKTEIEAKLADAKELLGRLQDAEREALLSRDSVRPPSSVPASGRAAAAVQYAMAQVGKAYVFGAAGPSAFDCSGLTMMAWAQAGVSLPHSSSAQYGMGPHIAESDLQPGDLVFYYSPISHVGMYIGNGLIVNAENPSVGVKVVPLHLMPYVGAVRPG